MKAEFKYRMDCNGQYPVIILHNFVGMHIVLAWIGKLRPVISYSY